MGTWVLVPFTSSFIFFYSSLKIFFWLLESLGLAETHSHLLPFCIPHKDARYILMLLFTGWGEWGWEVYHVEAPYGGSGTCSGHQTCSQVGPTSPLSKPSCAVAAVFYGHCPPSPLSTLPSACRNLKIGYFSQHHVEQLDLNVSAVELLARKFPGASGT